MTDNTDGGDHPGKANRPSFSELLGEATDLGQRGAKAWAEVRQDWEARSQTDTPWTTDTVMNEVVNSWERVTPLIGEAIDTSIAGFTWMLENWWRDAPDDLATIQASMQGTAAGDVLGPYMDIPRDAAARMMSDDYRSADAVEHWAQLFGMSAKNAWRASASAGQGDQARGDGASQPPDADDADDADGSG